MKRKTPALAIMGALLFWLGCLLQLCLSGAVAWGEIEARAYTPIYSGQNGGSGLDIRCPIMLSPTESGTISASISNPMEESASPVVIADISRANGIQQVSRTFSLAAHETQIGQWKVDASNIVWGRLILVNITQARFSDLPSREGACGIFIISLPGLNGLDAFGLLFALSLIGVYAGAVFWLRGRSPLHDRARGIIQAGSTLAGFSMAGLLVALLRWWGLILFFDVVALMMIGVIFTEFVLFPGRQGN